MHINATQPLCMGAHPGGAECRCMLTQHSGSSSAVNRCLILASEQRVHRALLWQCFIIKIPLRCGEVLSSLGYLTPVGGGAHRS